MVCVFDAAGRVILVRHTYGDRGRWELPGGHVHDGEDPADAARREVAEELGIDVALRDGVTVHGTWDRRRLRLACFAADWPGGRGVRDPVEIAEVAWFDPADPPAGTGQATRAALSALLRRRAGGAGAAPPGPSGAPRA